MVIEDERLYLCTSGDLPRSYEHLGWVARERLVYLAGSVW